MDERENEFENPGGNYPDRGDAASEAGESGAEETEAGSDHFGKDGGRDTLTVGEAQRQAGPGGVQDLPAMSQNNADAGEKIRGIIVQTSEDLGEQPQERIEEVLRQRLTQSGLSFTDEDLAGWAGEVATQNAEENA